MIETNNLTKLHGYKKHVVSDFCKDRYPYIENKAKEWEDSRGVFRSTNFRVFENLKKTLFDCNSSQLDRREALLILNEMSNH